MWPSQKNDRPYPRLMRAGALRVPSRPNTPIAERAIGPVTIHACDRSRAREPPIDKQSSSELDLVGGDRILVGDRHVEVQSQRNDERKREKLDHQAIRRPSLDRLCQPVMGFRSGCVMRSRRRA
jgi:hypothetical protein